MRQDRPYQKKNTAEILACLQRGVPRTVYALPTGGGKTEVGKEVIRTVRGEGWSVVFTVHRRELLRQALETLRKAGIPARPVDADHEPDPLAPIHVASIDTLKSRRGRLAEWFRSVDLVIPDEAHHCAAPGWQAVIEAMKNAQCLGLTATPWGAGGKPLGHLFDEAVVGPTVAELTADGWLSPAEVWSPWSPDTSDVKVSRGDFVTADLERIMNNDRVTRMAMNAYAARMPGEPAIAFCVSVAHARRVAEMFSAAGWRAESVDGDMLDGPRDDAIKGLENGSVQLLASCALISEGVDVPVVSGAIFLRSSKSTLLVDQQGGRALRLCKGKTRSCIIDMAGNTQLHGLPGAVRNWSLEGGLTPTTYRTIRCPNCHRRFWPANICPTPSCGHTFLARDAQTVPLSIANLSSKAFERMTTAQLEHIAKSEADLRRIQREKGFADGWLYHAKLRLAQKNMQRRFG